MSIRPRVLLADDHAMLLEAFQRLLAPTSNVVGGVADGRALLEAAPRLQPDVIVVDICMPLLNGLDAFRQLQPRLPKTKWVFLTVNEDTDVAVEVFRLGGLGYLLKSSAASELFLAIEKAMRGEPYITPLLLKGMPLGVFLARTARPPTNGLTVRQREVVQLLAEGRLMKDVAGILGVTPRTVAFHKYSIMKQLGVTSSAELVQYAVQHGLVRR
jgi:DNA-binding NarL/FixJ family response regulator